MGPCGDQPHPLQGCGGSLPRRALASRWASDQSSDAGGPDPTAFGSRSPWRHAGLRCPAVVRPGQSSTGSPVRAVQIRGSCLVRTQWCSVTPLLLSKRELATAAAPSARHVDVVMR